MNTGAVSSSSPIEVQNPTVEAPSRFSSFARFKHAVRELFQQLSIACSACLEVEDESGAIGAFELPNLSGHGSFLVLAQEGSSHGPSQPSDNGSSDSDEAPPVLERLTTCPERVAVPGDRVSVTPPETPPELEHPSITLSQDSLESASKQAAPSISHATSLPSILGRSEGGLVQPTHSPHVKVKYPTSPLKPSHEKLAHDNAWALIAQVRFKTPELPVDAILLGLYKQYFQKNHLGEKLSPDQIQDIINENKVPEPTVQSTSEKIASLEAAMRRYQGHI